MKFIVLILPALALLAAAAPATTVEDPADDISHVFEKRDLTGEAELAKRGYGCNTIRGDDPGQCNFHCVNEVTFTCSSGKRLRPYKGACTGFRTGTCSCYYNTSC